MDIRAGIIAAIVLSAIGALLVFRSGYRAWMSARRLTFYRIRRQREKAGLFTVLISLILFGFAFILFRYGEPVAYRFFPPSPTITLTPTTTVSPTITLSPTITPSPTITETPSVTDTATITPTPFIPPAIEVLFESEVTPNANAVFSPLQFTRNCADFNNYTAETVFQNPINYMCAVFTYDQMTPGAQWTALWFRDGKLVHYETIPWNGETGGYGYTEWEAPASEWLPGNYQVQVFVGLDWKVVGEFLLEGEAPTAIPTASPSLTLTPSKTLTPTNTGTPTRTPTATKTPIPTLTPLPSATP
jgi:hypothetical protein